MPRPTKSAYPKTGVRSSSHGGVRTQLLMLGRRNWKVTAPEFRRSHVSPIIEKVNLDPPPVPLTNLFACIENDSDSDSTSDSDHNCVKVELHSPIGAWRSGPPPTLKDMHNHYKPLPLKPITNRCWADDVSDDEA